jgi:hypothetical protein
MIAAGAPRRDARSTMAPPHATKLVIAELGNDAGAIGAATMAFRGGLTAPAKIA